MLFELLFGLVLKKVIDIFGEEKINKIRGDILIKKSLSALPKKYYKKEKIDKDKVDIISQEINNLSYSKEDIEKLIIEARLDYKELLEIIINKNPMPQSIKEMELEDVFKQTLEVIAIGLCEIATKLPNFKKLEAKKSLNDHKRMQEQLNGIQKEIGEEKNPDYHKLETNTIKKGMNPIEESNKEQIISQFKNIYEAFKNPNLHAFIRWRYQEYYRNEVELLERKSINEIYPVVVIRPKNDSDQINNVDSVLIEDLNSEVTENKNYITTNTCYKTLISKVLGKKLDNKYTYAMKKINIGNNLTLECEIGTYFDGLDTCHSLEWEIFNKASNLKDQNESTFKKFNKQLLLRNNLHNTVKNPIIDGSGRSATIGISTLIIYKDNGIYYMFVRRRSKSNVSVDQGLLHVIPSSTFQPMTVFQKQEFKVSHNIYREYLEELFNRPELKQNDYWKTIYNDEIYKHLKGLLDHGKAKLLFSGLAINLFTLRPEICTVLIIDSEEWIEYHAEYGGKKNLFKFNEEWENKSNDYPFLIGQIEYKDDDNDLKPKISALDIAPPGAAAFWLGYDLFKNYLSHKN